MPAEYLSLDIYLTSEQPSANQSKFVLARYCVISYQIPKHHAILCGSPRGASEEKVPLLSYFDKTLAFDHLDFEPLFCLSAVPDVDAPI